jgi:glutaconate CoA-transferase, subunit A
MDMPPRNRLAGRRNRASKVRTMSAALDLVNDDAFLAIGGLWFQNNPSAAVRELVRRKTKRLTIVAAPPSSYAVDLLLGAGSVTRAYVAHVSFDHLGLAPNFRRAAETGSVDLVDCDEATVLAGLMATLEELPSHPVTSIRGTDLISTSPLAAQRDWTGIGLVSAPVAMRPDVCILHAQQADEYGNVRYFGTPFCDALFAKVAQTVIVTVDEIVSNEAIRSAPHETVIPSYLVDAIVEAPYGAHPCASQGLYTHDETHLSSYITLGASETRWRREYLDQFVMAPVDLDNYVSLVGGRNHIDRLAEVVA